MAVERADGVSRESNGPRHAPDPKGRGQAEQIDKTSRKTATREILKCLTKKPIHGGEEAKDQ